MYFLTGVQSNKEVVATTRPFHDGGLARKVKRLPFTRFAVHLMARGALAPWP